MLIKRDRERGKMIINQSKYLEGVSNYFIEAKVINHIKSLEPTYQVLAQAELKLEQFKHSQYINTASLPSRLSLGSVGGHNSSRSPQAHCKLPKIGLPQFTRNGATP